MAPKKRGKAAALAAFEADFAEEPTPGEEEAAEAPAAAGVAAVTLLEPP